jgi:hypothetical protein
MQDTKTSYGSKVFATSIESPTNVVIPLQQGEVLEYRIHREDPRLTRQEWAVVLAMGFMISTFFSYITPLVLQIPEVKSAIRSAVAK